MMVLYRERCLRLLLLYGTPLSCPAICKGKLWKDVVNVLPSDNTEARREMFFIAHMLLERKKQYFSDNQRMIMDYHITESAHSIHVDVVSTVPEGYHPEL